MSIEDLARSVFRHPAYLAHALDGEIVRICKGDGDIYIGEPSTDSGVEIEKGTILMNPDRHQIDCATPEETPVIMTTDEVKEDEALLKKAIATLDHAEKNPEMILSKETGRQVYEQWIKIAQANKEAASA